MPDTKYVADPDRYRGKTDRRFDPKESKRRKELKRIKGRMGAAAKALSKADLTGGMTEKDYRTPWKAEPLKTPKVDRPPKLKESLEVKVGRAPSTVSVGKGDTLGGIARRHGVSLSAMKAANSGLKDPNRIKIGQKLTLPKGSKRGN